MRSLLTAAAISLAFTLFLTPVFLRLFRKWGWGQVIRTPEDVHNPSHGEKRGTPTMGGTIFIVGTIVGYLVGAYTGNNPPTISGLLVMWMMVGFGAVGFIDDYMKVRRQRSLGLTGWRKIVGQVIVVVPFAHRRAELPERVGPDARVARTSRSSATCRCCRSWRSAPSSDGCSTSRGSRSSASRAPTASNVADGLDGLAAGAGVFVVGAYSLIAFWQFQQACTRRSRVSTRRSPRATRPAIRFDLAIVSAAFVGALVGFLWWNAPKAQVFMGDVGSMAIGGVIAAMAILTRTELLADPRRRRLRHRPGLGHPAAALLQAHPRQTPVPDEPVPPPPRDARLVRDHDRRAHVDHRRHARGLGHRALLRRVARADMTDPLGSMP